MPAIVYESKKFRDDALEVIDAANVILAEFAEQGFDLTLRQLYYQFVARGYLKNEERSYKRLGKTINDARLAGYIDWKSIVDRTRETEIPNAWDSPAEIIKVVADQYAIDLWKKQSHYVEAWIEKDALVGVLEGVSKELNIPYLSCRGYTSQSEMWKASQRLLGKVRKGKKVLILHLGDHDPSGIDMTRDIDDRLSKFISMDYVRLIAKDRKVVAGEMHDISSLMRDAMDLFEVRRIALTMDQIEEFNPPPNPAKVTDSRYEGYVAEHGHESWELDALSPQVLAGLVREHTQGVIDQDLWEDANNRQEKEKDILTETSSRWEDVVEFLTE
jgi:hypothetical protein